MSYFIGIDIGTGSTKAVAIDENAMKVLSTEQVSYPTLQPSHHYSEQSPELVWQAFLKCVARIVAEIKSAPKAIGISSAMHSLIPVDSNGNPLMNMITWADGRSADIAERIKNSPTANEIYSATGTPIHAMSPLCKIIWIKENQPELFKTTFKFISIKEYIWYKLFHDFQIDHSVASATGLFDILTLNWYAPALLLAGIEERYLSNPVSTSYTRSDVDPEVHKQLQLDTRTTFVIGATDGCLANLGSRAITPGIASLTIGTSGAIRIASSKPCYNFKSMIFNYRLDDKTFICGGPVNNGGAVLNWYLKNLLEKEIAELDDYAALFEKADHISPGAEGLIFLPYLMGERAPIWNSSSCGVFFGISNRHRQEHFTKAVIEGISLALYSVGKALEDASGNIDKIYASGGFVHSTIWLQLMADVFNKEIARLNTEDASSIGAALMAMKAILNTEDYPALNSVEPRLVITPDTKKHQRYQLIFPLFTRLYEKLKDEMNLVYQLNNN